MDKNNFKQMNEMNINGQNKIDAELLNNVKQPVMAQALIKLRESYCAFMKEAKRGRELYGAISDQGIDQFVDLYNDIASIMVRTMANIMEAEVDEAIEGDI